MSFEIDEKNSNNSMIIKDVLNEFPFDKSEIKEDLKESESKDLNGISLSRVIDLDKYNNILQILKCKLCLNILLNPYDCSKCGNTFCYSCISKLKQSNKKCPFGCTDYEITPSSFAIKKFLNQLKFSCLNKENGCNEIISYSNIEQHDKNCEYINAICPNNQCRIKLPWNLLKNHVQNECPYTLYECDKCHLKLNRKEYETHNKLCNVINKEFEKQSPLVNKMTKEDLDKKREDFCNLMDSIENLNFFRKEKNKEEINNKEDELYFNNNDMNLLVKSLVFIFSRKMGLIEDKINKINTTLEQFSENNLIFYQSINEELENINEKISNINNNINNNNESTSNKNSTSNSNINNINNTFSPENVRFNSPIITDTKKIYNNKNKTIFQNKDEKLLLSNIINERQKSQKTLEKFKSAFTNQSVNTSRNKSKKKNNELCEKINTYIIDKNRIIGNRKGTTINNLINKEKFIRGMKSTQYMEKIKGIHNKKKNLIITTDNPHDKLKNEYINTNIINGQRNNYIISNNFNTINSYNDKTYSEKSSSKIIEQNLSGGNNQDLFITNNTIK